MPFEEKKKKATSKLVTDTSDIISIKFKQKLCMRKRKGIKKKNFHKFYKTIE